MGCQHTQWQVCGFQERVRTGGLSLLRIGRLGESDASEEWRSGGTLRRALGGRAWGA